MDMEATNIVKKTVKIAGVTCLALGGAALIASGAALKALAEGTKYLKDTVKEIIDEEPKEEAIDGEASEEDFAEAVVAENADEAQEVADALTSQD